MPRHKTLPYPIRAAGCVVFLVSADKKIQYLLLHRQGLNHWIPPKGMKYSKAKYLLINYFIKKRTF